MGIIAQTPILYYALDTENPLYCPFSPIQDLANAGATKRPTCCVLVLTKPTKGELAAEEQQKLETDYKQVVEDVKELTSSFFA